MNEWDYFVNSHLIPCVGYKRFPCSSNIYNILATLLHLTKVLWLPFWLLLLSHFLTFFFLSGEKGKEIKGERKIANVNQKRRIKLHCLKGKGAEEAPVSFPLISGSRSSFSEPIPHHRINFFKIHLLFKGKHNSKKEKYGIFPEAQRKRDFSPFLFLEYFL